MAAQDAELKLKVSLDLGFFRQQLAGLGQAAAGYSMPVQVKFDRRAVQNELNALGANIRKRDYKLTIQTNLKAEIEAAKKLAQAFSELERGAFASASQKKGSFTQKSLLSIPSADIKKLYKEAANAGLLSYDETIANNKNKIVQKLSGLGKDSVAGLLNGLNSENEKLKTAAKNLGKDLIASVKAVLGIASPSKEFKKIGEDSGEGFEQGLKIGFGEAGDVGVREIEKLFQRLQKEAKAGSALLQAIMAGAMSGVMQLPGRQRGAGGSIGQMIRQQRAQVRAERQAQAGGMSALMMGMMGGVIPMGGTPRGAGGSISAMIRQQRTAVQAQRQAQAGSLSALMIAMMSGVVPMGGKPRGAGGSIKELIQQERAKVREENRPLRIESLIAALSSARGNLSPAAGVNQRLATGGAVNPGVLSSGYIGRSALSPKFVNYPAGMPPAYATGFIEPTAFGSLAAGTTGRYGMGGAAAFPSSPMMKGGIGAGGGSFIPMQEVAASSNRAKEAISGFTARLKNLADFVAGNQSLPISPAQQRQAAAWANSTRQGNLGSRFVGPSGNVQSYAGNFPVSGMMGPSSPLGRITAQSSMFAGGGTVPPSGGGGGFGGMGGFGGFGRALGGVNLPGAGVNRELGSEFAFATKQVLLFGQAYKMLAFIQNFPAEVGAAVSQLQNFRNTLGAISPTAQEAAASNQLILDLVDKYNVPLQSARDGFTKLYASMAPAGFSGDEIRDLFTGITQAAATFGMSADKVDRVNYAFAQMASKGQVMSEELKGQLGDVLPGAMALFAEAAGFEGPKAIQDFSQALEDGAYKGEAMVALLKNVGIVMKQEFGPGAEGAARTFQGVINRMQNSMVLLYESFEPVAINFLNGVVVPLTSGIKEISDGFKSFFTGVAAQTTGGFAIAQELERLRPAFDGIRQNAALLIEQFGQFARIALEVSKVLLQIAGNPIVGYLARLYAIALPINIALNVMRGLWAANILQLAIFNTRVATGTSTLTAFRGMMAATGATAQTTAASIRTAGITLRTFFATTGVGLVIVGISMLIEKFMSMNQALADTKAKALGAAQAIRSMSQTEARAAEQQAQSAYKLIGQIAGRQGTKQPGGDRLVPVSQKELSRLQQLGPIRSQQAPGGPLYVKRSEAMALAPQAQRLQSEAAFRQRQIRFEEQQTQQQAVLAPISPSEGDGKGKKGKELDQYIQDATNALALEKESLLVAVEDKMLRGEISETEAKRQSLLIEKLQEEKAITEAFRVAQIKLAGENLSAADKQLKLADLRAEKEQKIANIAAKYGVEVLKAELALQQPLKEAIESVNGELDGQAMIRENLKDGITGLTYDQKAYLDVQRLTKDMNDAEKLSVQQLIEKYQRKREEYYKNEEALKRQQALREAETGLGIIGGGLRAGFTGSAAGVFERAMEQSGDSDYATKLANIETSAMQLRAVFEGLQAAIAGVSGAFANMLTEGIGNMITGTATAQEVFTNFLQSVGQALSQAASQMIATYIAIGIAKMFAGLSGGGGKGGLDTSGFTKYPMLEGPGFTPFANGGIAPGGFKAFANGGVVSGPTLGLVGEGKYNEAIVPLPDGKSIPVQLGAGSVRDMMNAQGSSSSPVLNMSFESTKINGVEYVSRDQLEQAMAATRRQAANDGAKRGMNMTLDRIQQSPQTRSRIGIR